MQQFAPSDPAGSAPAPQQKPKSDIGTTIIAWVIVLALVGGIMFFVVRYINKEQNKLTGTYYDTYGVGSVTFVDDKNITMNTLGLNVSGTYQINGSSLAVTYNIPLLGAQTINYSFSHDGDIIYLNNTQYIRRD